MSKKKIYELDFAYRCYRKYVVFSFKKFYSKFIVLGRENIPQEGPVILGPNHLNALMDPLALLASTPQKLSIVYLARADVFKNNLAAKGLRFVKILPAFRMRDGIENLGKNNETFDMAQETLEHKYAIGIMPEGSQGEQRKLRPIVKGIFRIAFSTQKKIGDADTVKIIPIGLDYSDIVDFGAELIVNYGKPIEATEYMDLYSENPAKAINEIRNRFSKELHHLTVDIASEQYYECFETTIYVANTDATHKLNTSDNTESRFYARQKLATHLVELEKNEPETVSKLDKICKKYKDFQKSLKLKNSTLEKPAGIGKLLFETLGLLITLPVFIAGFLLNMIPFFTPVIIRKALKVKYRGFFSSFNYFLGIVITFPLFYIIQTIIYAIFNPLAGWAIPIFAVAQYFLGMGAFEWYKISREYTDNIRYHWLKMTQKKEVDKLQKIREEIILLGGLRR